MDLVKISLEALLQRATNAQNENVDKVAVEAFCALVDKEKEGVPIGVKLLAVRMHSKNEQEALQTLHILDYSMQKCGVMFQDEIGKFRFLNEMIKLVSPKYLGCHTPHTVKQKVLQLMYLWMLDYPKQSKIKDAYDMLKKQGVIKDVPLSIRADCTALEKQQQQRTVFHDEEKGKLLKKLLQSKNPEDLQAANRLIKTMVKEDERKAELKSRKISELESVQNNIRLLNEMLDSFKNGVSSQDEIDLIKELHASCTRMSPNITKLASETEKEEEILNEILRINDELRMVLEKFQIVIIRGEEATNSSLLDVESKNTQQIPNAANKSNVDVLCDILTTPIDAFNDFADCNLDGTSILTPIVNTCAVFERKPSLEERSKRGLDDLDALGQLLLLENLQSTTRQACFSGGKERVPMNLLQRVGKDLNVEQTDVALSKQNCSISTLATCANHVNNDESIDDLLVDITTTPTTTPVMTPTLSRTISASSTSTERKDNDAAVAEMMNCCRDRLKLGDLFVDLKDIKPDKSPITVLNEKNGITVTIHFGKAKPHEDVSVFVVTIVSKHDMPLKNILFRAIVPKSCKVKLQPASGTDLPAFNPFLPAASITQVMLIANPDKVHVSLKFIVSYNLDDETMTEMGEIESLT